MRSKMTFLMASALVVVPATAQVPQQRTLSQRDVQEAVKQHPQVVAEFGGAETGPRAA